MPDFAPPPTLPGLTKADDAVRYIMNRVISDANFQHYMLHTEALRLCFAAEAERLGSTEEAVRQELDRILATRRDRLKRIGKEKELEPEVVRLRKEVETKPQPSADALQMKDMVKEKRRLEIRLEKAASLLADVEVYLLGLSLLDQDTLLQAVKEGIERIART